MGEEDRRYDADMAAAAGEEEEEEVVGMEVEEGSRVREWEAGLPGADDLMPLSQLLIPPELATAFSVSPERRRSSSDVHRASRHTLSSIRRGAVPLPFPGGDEPAADEDGEEYPDEGGGGPAGEEEEESRKTRREDSSATTTDDAESGSGGGGDAARAAKRPRLVWTPQLHKRFVDVVTHLGIKKAVPKTIMQLMNVEGLTRENVASHLQKYRLYLKRQGLPYDGPSTSDHSQSGDGAAGMSLPVPMQYGPPLLPMQSMNHHPSYHGFHSHSFGSMVSYPHAARREK